MKETTRSTNTQTTFNRQNIESFGKNVLVTGLAIGTVKLLGKGYDRAVEAIRNRNRKSSKKTVN